MLRWLLLIVLVTTGCGARSGRATTTATTTTSTVPPRIEVTTTAAPAPTTVATSASSFAVPAVIDLAYVQRVLKTIYRLDGDASRRAYAMKAVDLEVVERLEAIFGGPRLTEAKRVLAENAVERFILFADPPGDAIVRAVEIIQATPTCMVIRADLEYGPLFKEPRPPQPQAIIQLRRADVLPFNPTGWGVVVAGDPAPGQDLKVCERKVQP